MSRNAITLLSTAERERAIAWIRNAPSGSTVEFRGPRRNCDQNALMWSLLGQLSKQLPWYGKKLSSEDYKDLCSASLRQYDVVPGIDPGTFVPLGMRTSQMTKAEMTSLIELILAFGAERGVKFREFETVENG